MDRDPVRHQVDEAICQTLGLPGVAPLYNPPPRACRLPQSPPLTSCLFPLHGKYICSILAPCNTPLEAP